jgi:hypothetical protein
LTEFDESRCNFGAVIGFAFIAADRHSAAVNAQAIADRGEFGFDPLGIREQRCEPRRLRLGAQIIKQPPQTARARRRLAEIGEQPVDRGAIAKRAFDPPPLRA